MINAQQFYCHTLAYHIPTANRTLQQWRPQLVTSTPLTPQTFIKTEAKFVPYKEYLGIKPRRTKEVRHVANRVRCETDIKFLSENLKGK
jgi:hypothetical protein